MKKIYFDIFNKQKKRKEERINILSSAHSF